MDYKKQAQEIADAIGLTMTTQYLGHFGLVDEVPVARWRITLTRKGRSKTFDYGDSINNSWKTRCHPKSGEPFEISGVPHTWPIKTNPVTAGAKSGWVDVKGFECSWVEFLSQKPEPTIYDITVCLTKFDPGSHKDFCSDFGCDPDSIKSRDIYLAVAEEWHKVDYLFHDVLEQIQEIA